MQIITGKKDHMVPPGLFMTTTPVSFVLNEYMLVLLPHEELRKRVLQIRKDFYEAYQAPSALGAKVHLRPGHLYAAGDAWRSALLTA